MASTPNFLYMKLEKVTRFTGFAGGKVIKAIHLTFRLQSSSLFADSTWPFLNLDPLELPSLPILLCA